MKLFLQRLKGRVAMALNTARIHPDKHVSEECQVRARAYMNAIDDALADEELLLLDEMFATVAVAKQAGILETPEMRAIKETYEKIVVVAIFEVVNVHGHSFGGVSRGCQGSMQGVRGQRVLWHRSR